MFTNCSVPMLCVWDWQRYGLQIWRQYLELKEPAFKCDGEWRNLLRIGQSFWKAADKLLGVLTPLTPVKLIEHFGDLRDGDILRSTLGILYECFVLSNSTFLFSCSSSARHDLHVCMAGERSWLLHKLMQAGKNTCGYGRYPSWPSG